jgi:alpha-mannosidase
VVRIVETAGRGARAIATLPARDRPLEVDIGPFEIRTFRVPPAGTGGAAVETDLLERPLEPLDSSLETAPHGTAATTA